MTCKCNTELIWGGDDTYEDCGVDGEGIVSNFSCPNELCNVEAVYTYEELDSE